MNNAISFPVFRKYKNNMIYFKIISQTKWQEVHKIGTNKTVHNFEVKILPDRNFINDMLFDYEKNWDAIEESDYVSFINSGN
jgi:hypothetical protein